MKREEVKIKFDDEISLFGNKFYNDEKEIKGIVQLVHGMAEHISRYDQFCEFLVKEGFMVLSFDLYAHGKTCGDPEKVGVVEKYDFMDTMIKSVKTVREYFDEEYNKYSINCLFGHSMGSMISQYYVELYPEDFNYLILSGPEIGRSLYKMAKVLTKLFMKKDKIVYSDFIHNISLGGFNKKFKNDHPTVGWLSRNDENRRSYELDPYCGKMYPVNYFYSLSVLLLNSIKKENLSKINKNLKVFVFSGIEDPVTRFGENVPLLKKRFDGLGINVITKIYDNARHEVLNESDEIKKLVYNDIIIFLNS